ncbi:unnamed protein product [Notodromas monacha]|uniref:Uncharacterized protein n=1 Tax=Notodromas monacha TaxID=399045 RepID=A0A7R9BNA4_9CRUS|nr:unnamed protein product [Notodromas monacha]CAG0918659.1 unnamed protein product [Notodromas monacha]
MGFGDDRHQEHMMHAGAAWLLIVAAIASVTADYIPLPTSSGHRASTAQLYSWPDLLGASIIVDDYCGNLANCSPDGVNYDNVISSACVTGMWLFYEEYDFGANALGAMEYAYGTNFCFNLNFVNDAASSMRYVGNREDYMANGITVYQYRSFKGMEYFSQYDVPVFPMNIRWWPPSAIISGNLSWTLYEFPYFEGRSVCLHARTDYNFPTLFLDDMAGISLPRLGSMSKGCQPRRTQVNLYPSQRSKGMPRRSSSPVSRIDGQRRSHPVLGSGSHSRRFNRTSVGRFVAPARRTTSF